MPACKDGPLACGILLGQFTDGSIEATSPLTDKYTELGLASGLRLCVLWFWDLHWLKDFRWYDCQEHNPKPTQNEISEDCKRLHSLKSSNLANRMVMVGQGPAKIMFQNPAITFNTTNQALPHKRRHTYRNTCSSVQETCLVWGESPRFLARPPTFALSNPPLTGALEVRQRVARHHVALRVLHVLVLRQWWDKEVWDDAVCSIRAVKSEWVAFPR